MASSFDAHFITIPVVFGGEIREAVEQSRIWLGQGGGMSDIAGKRTIGFVDEVHRFNKAVKSFINQIVIRYLCNEFVRRHHFDGVKAHG